MITSRQTVVLAGRKKIAQGKAHGDSVQTLALRHDSPNILSLEWANEPTGFIF
jgi:hypothetical protein